MIDIGLVSLSARQCLKINHGEAKQQIKETESIFYWREDSMKKIGLWIPEWINTLLEKQRAHLQKQNYYLKLTNVALVCSSI